MIKSEFLALIQSAKYDTYKAMQKADKRHDKILKLLILAYKNLESACDLYSDYVYEKGENTMMKIAKLQEYVMMILILGLLLCGNDQTLDKLTTIF